MFELTILVLKYVFLVFLYFFIILIVRLVYLDLYYKRLPPRGPHLIMLESDGNKVGGTFKLEDELKIGRDEDNQIVIDDAYASGLHARVYQQGDHIYVEDMGSTNGTFVKERKIKRPVSLRSGDQIRVGHTNMRFEQ